MHEVVKGGVRTAEILRLSLLGALVCMALFVWSAVFAREGSGTLSVAFLDVGQGDAILIEAPGGARVLIDGGKGGAVLRALGEQLAFGDRSLDVIIATHPDLDHIGGLPEVFARYEVGMFIEPCVADDGADYAALREAVRQEGLETVCAGAGMALVLEEGVRLDLLFPDRDARSLEANTASVVARLSYGDTAFLFTGDSPIAIEEYLASVHGDSLASDVLKLGHHGSKTSTSELWLKAVRPEHVVISVGCDNTYGHPHKEVIDRLEAAKIATHETCNEGTIVFGSDGYAVTRR